MRAWNAAAILAVCAALAGCDRFGSIRSDNEAAANASTNAAFADAAGGQQGDAGQAAGPSGSGLAAQNGGAVQAGSGPAGNGPAGIDRGFLVGRWADHDDDCDRAADFFADGRFVPANGAEGLWSLNGDRLSIVSEGNTFTVQLVPIDRNSMRVVNADGSLGRSTRC